MALDLFEGDAGAARSWFSAPAPALANRTPLEVSSTDVGAREVENLIGRLEHGVFS
jgi:putative toxin-antitoxin system antitoxin component (TIGR02293 family)